MRINLYDKDLNRIAFIDENFISVLWQENYNSTGNFTMELPATAEYKQLVKPECYVTRWDRPTVMVIKTVTVNDNKLVAQGKTADRQLDDVAFIGTINANSMVANRLKSAYESTDKYSHFVFANSDLTDKFPSQVSHKSMRQLLEIMCQGADVGYKAVKNGGNIEIQFYKPSINGNLKFSKDYGNLQDYSIIDSTEAEKNYAIVLGAGDGDNRAKAEVDIRADKTTEQKRAVIIDAKDIQMEESDTQDSYKQKLIERGVTKLLDYQRFKEVDFTPIYELGKDFELGDILTALLNDYGIKIQARITSFTQKQQNNSLTTTIELGEKHTLTSATTHTSGESTKGGGDADTLGGYPPEYYKYDTYTTDEQRIGTWIDGKPLYRQVKQTTNFAIANGTTNLPSQLLPTGMSSIKYLVDGVVIINATNSNDQQGVIHSQFWKNGSNIQILSPDSWSASSVRQITIIYLYTKSTD